MKKTMRISLLLLVVLIASLALSASVMGKGKGNPKGEIVSINAAAGTLVIAGDDGEITVSLPEGYDLSEFEVGMTVLVKGTWISETEIDAEWVKAVGPHSTDDEEEDEEDGEEDSTKAWCSDEKDGYHPLAEKLAARYGEATGVTAEQVQTWYCEGYSIGEIMLALTTQIMDGTDPAETLAERGAGKGWGRIWKERGLIGDEREGDPPGWSKKPNKDKFVPPGQAKKTPKP